MVKHFGFTELSHFSHILQKVLTFRGINDIIVSIFVFNKEEFMTNETQKLALKANAYRNARYFILVFLIMTVANVIMINTIERYFLFSASFPLLFIDFGLMKKGSIIAIALFILCLLVFAGYVVCFILSKKSYIPLIIITVLFGIDCLLLIYLAITGGFLTFIIE